MTNPLGGRHQDKLMAICLFPSINFTPCKPGIPVPYPVWHMMGNSEAISGDTHFNEEGVYILNQTVQPTCIGDFLGQGGGVKSGTVSDEIRPTKGSTTIFVNGQALIRKGDPCTLNKANTFGKYTTLGSFLSGLTHLVLGALSFAPPPIGTVASLADAALYALEGDFTAAAMSAAGAVPGVKYAQAAKKVVTAVQGTKIGTKVAAAGKMFRGSGALIKGTKKCKPCVLGSTLSMALGAHELISTVMGVADYAKSVFSFFGSPVHAISGAKVLMGNDDLDYQGTGHLPFYLQRLYNSQNDDIGWFGQGWKTGGLEQYLELDPQHDTIYLVDNSARRVPFNYLAPGKLAYQAQEDITLYRLPLPKDKAHTQIHGQPILADATSGTRIGTDEPFEFILLSGKVSLTTCQALTQQNNTTSNNTDSTTDNNPNQVDEIDFNGIAQHFTKVIDRADNGTFAKVLLTKQSDKYHHKLQLHYTHTDSQRQHLPSFITDDAGNCYHLGFGLYDDTPRLNCLEHVHHINETGTVSQSTPLAQYRYDKEGNLIEVIIKGITTRRFGYTKHLMTHQSFLSGQEGFYTYDQTDNAKTAKVTHHTLNTGEDYRFYYDSDKDINKHTSQTTNPNTNQTPYHTTTVVEQEGTPDERRFVYVYDDNFTLHSYQNPHKHRTYFVHDGNDKLIRVFNDQGQEARFIYKQNNLTQSFLKVGVNRHGRPVYRTWHYTYDPVGKLVAITNPKNHTITLAYTHKGELSAITDELGHTTHYAYDNDGNVIKETLANQSHHHYHYDDLGNLITHTDCSGHTTTYHHTDKDHPERLTAITDAKGHTTRYGYTDTQHSLTAHKTTNTHPHLSLISHIHKADNTHIHLDYDQAGRLICHTDELGNQTHYTYTKDNLPVSRTDAGGHTLCYHYDKFRRLIKLVNENHEDWTFVYDQLDNLICETRFDDTQSTYRYDKLSQLTALIDNAHLPKVHQRHTHLQRDLIGQLVAKHAICYEEADIDPIANTSHQASTNTTPKRLIQTHKYAYDELGQLIRATSGDATTHLDFDPVGNLVKETLIRHHANQGQEPNKEVNSQTLSHTYDELGNRISTTLPDGTTLNNLYYGSGHLYNQSLTIQHSNTTGKDGQAEQGQTIYELRHSQTNELHQEVLRWHGQGKVHQNQSQDQSHHTAFDYDVMGRLIKQFVSNEQHLIAQKHYTYDKKGQLTHVNTQTRLNQTHKSQASHPIQGFNRTHQYTYDKVGRLTEHKLTDHQAHTGHTEVFAFDPASNRVPLPQTSQTTNGQANTQEQGQEQGHALTGIHPKTKRPISLISQGKQIAYSYDVHGNIKTKTETPLNPKTNEPIYQSDNGLIGYRKSIQFAYNPNNELKQTITITDTGLEVQRTTTQYHYDAFGRRIAKTSKVERLNKLNQQGKPVKYPTTLLHLRKTDKTEHQSTLMLWEGNRQIQEYANHHIFTTVYDQDSFEPVARVVQARNPIESDNTQETFKVYHYHNNHLGTPQELSDEQGNIIWANYEWAWGGTYTKHYNTQYLNNIEIKDYELQPLKFQGQSLDIETGLHYNRFRYYDSDVGMFIQRDPIGLLGGVNVYQYVISPTGFIDPFGLAQTPLNKQGFTVYGLFRPGEDIPYYVGHTEQSLTDRLNGHINKEFSSQGNLTRADKSTEIRSLKGSEHSLTYTQSKGYEQAFRELYQTKERGFPGNLIEPIDKDRTDKRGITHMQSYKDAAADIGIQATDKRGNCV